MNQNFKSIIHNYFLKMSHFNYLFFAIALFIIGIFGYLGLTKYSKSHAFGFEQPMQCDTTEKAEFSLFDLSILLRKNINSKSFSERSFVVYEKDSLQVLKFVFNKNNGILNQLSGDSISVIDSIAVKSIFQKSNDIYEKWAVVLKPFRVKFTKQRNEMIARLRADNEVYKFKIIDDIRKMDRQMQVLSNGKSAAALSLHQFGLASDIGIFKGKNYLKSGKIYQKIGEESAKNDLTWGGNFKGLAGDFGHVQLYRNSAEMLSNIPELRYEYEIYRSYYIDRISKLEKMGKGDQVEDSKELVQVLDVLADGKICGCEVALKEDELKSLATNLAKKEVNFTTKKDFLAYFDYSQNYGYLLDSANTVKKLKLGVWR